jgi:uncharacterized protein
MLKEDLREIVRFQRKELANLPVGISREAQKSIDTSTNHAVVLSGIRRCGKSTLLLQLLRKNKKFNYFNFDDPRASSFQLDDFEKLDEVFQEEVGACNHYFFDEIQNVSQWERFVRFLLDKKKKIVVTGSNASLLSRELGTRLTGRHLNYELFPFSYEEFLVFKKKKDSLKRFEEYLEMGGFPEFLESEQVKILQELFKNILFRDIVVRHNIRNSKVLQELAIYLLSNTGVEFTYNKLKEAFSLGSPNTVIDFISFLEDSYLLFTINKFDYSLKKQQVNPKKVYSIDNGLSRVNSVTFSDNKGRMLENLVFQKLRRTFEEIYYFQDKKECDFVIKEKNKITQAIQVCFKVTKDNQQREVEGLLEALEKFKLSSGVIVTFDQKDKLTEKGKEIFLIPVREWLVQGK